MPSGRTTTRSSRGIQFTNDGRADFAANPLNGQPLPTYEQAQTLFCNSPAQAANFAAWQARNFAAPRRVC